MSTRQIRKRVDRIEEKAYPQSAGMTWEDFCRMMWREDKQYYLEVANSPDGWMSRSFVAQFEREDAEREGRRKAGTEREVRARRLGPRSGPANVVHRESHQ